MSAVRQIGIKMVVDAQSVSTELPRATREFAALGAGAEQASARTTRSLAQVSMSVRDIVRGAAGLHIVSSGIEAISNAITALPREGLNFARDLEVSQIGMAGILGSMTAINGQQLDYNRALQISSEYIRKLNDDALRTAATSQELVTVFQALLAPGLGAKMTLEEIRQLTVVGTNAVKSIGLDARQVVQELRDLVAGGIQPASSTLANALGLKDSDIAKAKASSEGLFNFLMARLQGFEASSEAFGNTFRGKIEQIREGATRVAAEGMEPLITASKAALDGVSKFFVTIDENKNVTLNQGLIESIKAFSSSAVTSLEALRNFSAGVYEHREAVAALVAVYVGARLGNFVADLTRATAAKLEATQASRLAAAQAAVEAASNVEVATTSRQKLAAYLAELSAKAADAQAEVAMQAARIATLRITQEAIPLARAEVLAKLDSVRATMAQAEAQIAAARAAGAQSMALALLREGTDALSAAQARQVALVTELAALGRQQAGVQAALAAATAAQTAATNAAATAAAGLSAAQGASSVAARALSGAVGFLGGPIGIVTTALTLGVTAWTLWGNKGADAQHQVQSAVARSTPEILANLDKQIAALKQRNVMAAQGMGDIAKANGEAAQEAERLYAKIENLRAGKGVDGGKALPEPVRAVVLQALSEQYDKLVGKMREAEREQAKLDAGTGALGLTVAGAEQAWRKANDGIKTGISIQQEYANKLSASRSAFEQYLNTLEQTGADPEKIRQAHAEQDQVEAALAAERDKKIKEMGAAAATARAQGIDAEIAATKQGYKLLAAQTAGSLAEVEAQRKQGTISDADALERRTALQLADIDARRAALAAELALLQGRKDSAKEQANLNGELIELAQKRTNIEAQAAREQQALDAQAAQALDERVKGYEDAARSAAVNLRNAQLDTLEIGKTGAALGALRQARMQDAAALLERKALVMDGIDLSGRASKALRDQAQAMRDLFKTQGYNESARMVYDYAKAIDEANAATQFELNLTTMSQRDRAVALEQYRIAIDLKKRLAEIDAQNPADKQAAERLKKEATEAAARAQAGVADRVFVQEWTRTVDQVDDVFRQGFADMLNRGEDGWKSFNQSLVTTFKTTVANELYKAFAQPFVVNIVGNLMGLFGGGGGASAAGLVSGNGNILGLASNASSAYNLATGGFGSMTTAGMLPAGFAASIAGSTNPFLMGLSGAWGAGGGMLSTLNAGFGMIGSGAIGSGLGTVLGAVAPIALPLLALGLLGGSDEKRGDVISGTLGVGGSIRAADLRRSHSMLGGTDWYTQDVGVSPMDKAIQAQWTASLETVKSWTSALSLSTDKIDGFSTTLGTETLGDHGQLGIRLDKDGTPLSGAEVQAKINEAIRTGNDDLAKQIIGTWETTTQEVTERIKTGFGEGMAFEDVTKTVERTTYVASEFAHEGERAIDTLERLGGSLMSVNALFEQTGQALYANSLAGGAGASDLVDQFGGRDQFNTVAGSYVQNFYPAADLRARIEKQLSDELAKIDLKLPDTFGVDAREQWRQMAAAQDLSTESGRKAWATLLQLSDSFVQLTPAAGAFNEAVSGMGGTIKGILDNAMKADSAGAASQQASEAFQSAILDSITGALTTSLGDMISQSLVAPLMDSLLAGATASSATLAAGGAAAAGSLAAGGAYAAGANAQGGAAAASAMASGGSSAASAMVSGGAATGTLVASVVDQARAQIAAMGQILKDPDVQAGIKDISAAVGGLAGDLYGVRQSFGAVGFSAGGGGGGGGAAAKVDDLADVLKKLGETAADEVKRLRGLMVEDSPQSREVLLARFATSTAAARAGDQDALKLLPELSRAVEAATAASAISAVEVARMRGWLAGSLSQTLGTLNLDVPQFAVGTNRVPRDMLALIHEGEAIVPKAFNPETFGAAFRADDRGDRADSAELHGLRMSFDRFADAQLESSLNGQRLLLRAVRVLEQWERNGTPQPRTETWSAA